MKFDVKAEKKEHVLRLSLSGKLDAISAPKLEKEFLGNAENVTEIVLDCSALEYLSSAGLRSLMMMRNRMLKVDGVLKVLYPQPVVMETLEMTGLTSYIIIVRQGEEETAKNASMSRDYYPLRPIQRWLVDTHFQKAKSTMMNVGALVRLGDSVDMERLAEAMNGILESYDIFRCRLVFHPDSGEVCQRFDGVVEPVRVEHMSEEAFEERKKKLKEPFILINNQLYRVYIMQTPSGKYTYVDFYHALLDGTAATVIFLMELNMRYFGKGGKRKPSSYAEFVWEEAHNPPENLEEGRTYWRKLLEGFDEERHLPPVDVSGESTWKSDILPVFIRNINNTFFKECAFNENTFFLGAMLLALAKVCGQKEAIATWVHNGRMTAKEKRLMGLMIDDYPVRWKFGESETVEDYLTGLQEQIHQGFQYRRSLDAVYREGLQDDCVSFILQKGTAMGKRGTMSFCGEEAVILEMPENEISAAENVLDVDVQTRDDGGYDLVLRYDASRYSADSMGRFAKTMDEMVLAMQDGTRKVFDILEG